MHELELLNNDDKNTIVLKASLGEMISDIEHEINNPLAIISGRSNILKKYLDYLPIEQQSTFNKEISSIKNSANRIHNIVHRVNTISNYNKVPGPSKFKADEGIRDLLELCKYRIEKYQIQLSVSEISPVTIHMNYNTFQIILFNCLLYFIEYLKELKTAKQINLSTKNEGNDYIINISAEHSENVSLDEKTAFFHKTICSIAKDNSIEFNINNNSNSTLIQLTLNNN